MRFSQVAADALEANSIITHSISRLIGDIDLYQRQLRESVTSDQVVEETSKFLSLAIYYLVHAKSFLFSRGLRRAAEAAFSQRLTRINQQIREQEQILTREIRLAEGRGL